MATHSNPVPINPVPVTSPATAIYSHRSINSDGGAGTGSSPQARRSSVSSPWSHVVRGVGEPESEKPEHVPPATSSPSLSPPPEALTTAVTSLVGLLLTENDDNVDSGRGNNNVVKKPVWNKPPNSAAAAAEVVISPVMGGAVSWPALSDSTNRASPKSSSSSSFDSLKALSDGPVPVLQGAGVASSSHRQANTNNLNPNSTMNHVRPNRQRSMKRGGGNSNRNALANGGFSQQQGQGTEVEIAPHNSGKSGNSGAESSSWDNSHRDAGQQGGFGSQSHGGNEHHHQRTSNRRGNVGPRPRGDGTYHHGYGGRRDQERGNQDWNPHRGWGNRDARGQPQRGPARPFMGGPPHSAPPFIPPPMPVQPFRAPMVYPEVPSMFYIPGPHTDPLRMPMLAPMPPVLFHIPDLQLHTKIVNQIEYYFSNENLIKDTFLRQNMDEHGWVPVTLIAGFKKVMQLTDNIQLILDAVRSSTAVEVQGEKLRRRNDWNRWLLPPSVQNSTTSSPRSLQNSGLDLLAENLQSVSLDKTIRHGNAEPYLSRSSSSELSTPSNQFSNEMAGPAGGAQHAQPMPVGNPS